MKITNLEKTIGNFHLEVDDLYIEPERSTGSWVLRIRQDGVP